MAEDKSEITVNMPWGTKITVPRHENAENEFHQRLREELNKTSPKPKDAPKRK